MSQGKMDKAIYTLQLNTRVFPEIANTYDSLGEAFYHAGDLESAIKNYSIALTKDPESKNAKEMLDKINEVLSTK